MKSKPTYQELENQITKLKKQIEFRQLNLTIQNEEKEKHVAELIIAKEKAEKNEAKFRNFVNHSPDIIYKYSTKKGGMFWSDRVFDILGIEPDKITKDPFLWNNSIHPEDKPKVDKAILDYSKGDNYTIEYRIKTKQGKWVWLLDYFMHKDVIGDEIIIEGHATDITAIKKTEQKLDASNKKYEHLIQSLDEGYLVADAQGYITKANSTIAKMCGYKLPEEMLGVNMTDLYSNPGDRVIMVKEVKEKGKLRNYELILRKKNGETFWTLNNINLITNDKGEYIGSEGLILDITERKKAEQALKESERRWEFAIEGNSDGLWDWNIVSNEVFFSEQWKKMLGFSANEISGKLETWDKRLHPDDKEKVYEDINKYINGETDFYEKEYRILCKDNTYKWILDRGKIISYTSDNKPKRMIGTHSDISYRKKAELALKESEDKFRTIFEEGKSIKLLINPKTRTIVDANQAACEFYGYTRQVLTSMQVGDINQLSEKEISVKILAAKEKRLNHFEFEHKLSNGILKDVEVYSNLVLVNNEKRLFLTIHDITERKKAEQALIESEDNYRLLAETMKDVVIKISPTGEILYVGPSVVKFGGYMPEEETGNNISKYFANKDDLNKAIELLDDIVKSPKSGNFEFIFKSKNNKLFPVEHTFVPIIKHDKVVAIQMVLRNISDRKKIEQDLRESNKTKDKFFSIIAHDLRSPFNAIIGFSKLLLKNNGKYDEQKREKLIKPILNSASETFKLLNNLLDWARAQSNKIEFAPKQNSLKNIFSDIVLQTEQIAKQKGISLSFQLENEITIYTDEYMFYTVLRNLISNAIKFTEKNGKIELKAAENENNIIISVSDTGIGINNERKQKIFNISEKTSTKGTENETGTGLGLALCKEFVKKHNGEIWVESKENIGSTFSFSIPKKTN